MKLKNILTGSILSAAMVMSSCSLDEDLSAISNPDTFFATKAQCEAALNGTYIPLKSLYTFEYFLAVESVTDLASCMGSNDNCRALMTPAKPCFGSTAWTQGYLGVMRCNAALAGIEKSPIDTETKNLMMGEGIVMRAYYYYFLTSFFGDVPFYEDDVATREVQNKIAVLPRMSAVETRDSLIKELKYWVPKMKQCRTSEMANNRSGAAMGWMLIAKMAAWNKEWDTVIEAVEELEKIYGDLSQYPLEDVYFRNKNTPESIFEIQHIYVDGGLNYSSNVACATTPVKSTSNGKVPHAGIEIPELGTEAT
ncbi:MAG: RagB/SusD family nutrient uptake outer membrane protein, partial [Muribaculaceae bacterium]|nr:RagB/SusD family nutrient uptake outer membrane protein [Muribaculaceae bacterium]